MIRKNRYHEALVVAISAAIVAADIGGPQGTIPIKEEKLVEDSSDDDNDDEEEDSSDEESLVPRLSPGSDEL